jgi:hypothetical protein
MHHVELRISISLSSTKRRVIMGESVNQKVNFSSWLRLLLQAAIRHGFAVIFVLIVVVIYRMPHLSDLTVVIIQLENDFWVMLVFYIAILVMALLISYGNLVRVESVKNKAQDRIETNSDEHTPSKIGALSKITQAINLKDSKEIRIEENPKDTKSKEGDTIVGSNKNSEVAEDYVDRVFPKLLALYMILSIAFSVENTYYQLFGVLITFKFFFLLLTLFLIALTNPVFGSFLKRTFKWKSGEGWLPIIVVAIALGIILILGCLNDGGTKADIASLFWSMMCLSVVFFVLSISYNKRILCFKEKIAIPAAYILTLTMLAVYLVMLFDPELDKLKDLTPMVIIMVCLIGLYTIFLGLNYIGKIKKWPILTVVFGAAILLTVFVAKSKCFSFYEVSTVNAKNINPGDRLSVEVYVDQYIEERRDAILSANINEPFPIIMVSAEGGGSRAGHWAFLVHSYLYGKSEGYYKKHLFSITGASGGSVGSNMFYVQAHAKKDNYDKNLFLSKSFSKSKGLGNNEHNFQYKASQFYQNDYISSSIAGLLGRDLIASIFHLNYYRDRAEITETEWENEFDRLFDKGLLHMPYLDIMPKKNDAFTPPIMVTTTTHVQTGELYVMSPVKFNTNKESQSGFHDLLSEYVQINGNSNMIKRSAAMLLTARFPYLSPNGRISGIGQFGDGGYYDNVGGTVTRHLEAALIKGLRKDSLLTGKYRIKHLIITNNSSTNFKDCPIEEKKTDSLPIYSTQLITPAQMAVNAIFAHSDEFINATSGEFRVESKRTLIPLDINNRPKIIKTQCDTLFRPLIPLGRYLSVDAIRSLEARLKDSEVSNKLDKILKYQ